MIQNDISKRHQNDINDKNKKTLEISRLFSNPVEKSLFHYAQKSVKIVSALYMITDIMDRELPLVSALRTASLDLVSECYRALRLPTTDTSAMTGVLVRLEQVISLVEISSVARHISPMNADIIGGELGKLRELLVIDMAELRTQEKSFSVYRPVITQPAISDTLMNDAGFDDLMDRHESKRHQNDIKTTLTTEINQNDIINDKKEIKTTNQNDIDRKQLILKVISERHSSTMHDIIAKLPDYSDKTIQREIASLIEMGLIRREGNKRWAVYRAI